MALSDILILVVLCMFGIRGLINGLIVEVFSLLGIITGLIVSYKYYYIISDSLIKMKLSETYAKSASYAITFLVVYICFIVVAKLLSKFFKIIMLGWANRTGGFIFAFLKGGILIGILLTIVFSHIHNDSEFIKSIKKAPVTNYILESTPKLFEYVKKFSHVKKEIPIKQVI